MSVANAIIQHGKSGECFAAELDESGDAVALSGPLPTTEHTDPDSGVTDWSAFEDCDVEPWEADEENGVNYTSWTADEFAVVHRF